MTTVIRIPALLLLGFLAGCTTYHKQFERTLSTSLENQELTSAGQYIQPDLDRHPGKSGFALLRAGQPAFTARNAMTQIAEKTIDVQYFVWESDSIGGVLANQLVKAAQRGVRVRMLIDDFHSGGRDFGLSKLNKLPNFEVRLFNPFVGRDAKLFEFLSDMDRLNHRMHNKAFIMDNSFAVIGGRNIGDQYFGVSSEVNFRDLDIITAGPIVQDISHSFDVFWNSPWAIPIEAISKEQPTLEEAQEGLDRLQIYVDNLKGFPYPIHRTPEEIYQRMDETRHRLIWADAEIIYDDPKKKVGNKTGYQGVAPHLRKLVENLDEELLMEAAYFIAGDRGVNRALELKEKGIRVRVLTNSMATNDMAPAFAFYEKYREGLVANGVELYELRPDLKSQRKFWSILASKSIATLHTKVIVFDRDTVFIGSFNLDPRSADLNTEVGLIIYSKELARQVIEYMDLGTEPGNSYRLVLEKEDEDDSGDLVWISREEGEEIRETSDPKSGFWRPVTAWFISLFPVQEHI